MINQIKELFINSRKKGFFHLLSANFLIFFLGFFSQLAVAWILPVEDIGRVKTLQSFLSIFTIFSTLGYNISVLKLTSEIRMEGEKKYLFKKAIKYTIVSSLAIYIIILILSFYGCISKDSFVNTLAPFFYLIIFPLSLNSIFTSYLQGKKEFKLISKIQSISKALSIVLLVILTYYFFISGYTMSILFGFVFTSLLFIYFIYKSVSGKPVIAVSKPLKTHFKFSGYSTLANLASNIANNIDILLLSYLTLDKVEFGYYSFAVTLMIILRIIPQTIQQVTIPYFSEKANNRQLWLKTVKKYFILSLFINIAIVSLVFFIAPFVINFLYIGKYDNSILYFKIILIGWFFRGAYNILGGAIIGLGDIRFNFVNGLIIAILNSALMFFFIKYYNIEGAAWANAIGGFFAFIFISLRFYSVYVKNQKNV